MKWGGIIAGALGGLGHAAQQQATGYIEDERKANLAAQLSAMEEARAQRAAEYARLQGREEHLWKTTGPGGAATLAAEGKKGEQATAQRVDLETKLGPVQTQNAADAEKARQQAQREGVKATGNDPDYIAARRRIAEAEKVFGPQDHLARAQLAKLGVVEDLRRQLANTDDPAQRDKLMQKISDLEGNTKNTRDLSLALNQTEQVKAKVRAVLADPMADAAAKASAQESLDALTASANFIKRQMGLKEDAKPVPKAAIADLMKDPSPQAIAEFERIFPGHKAAEIIAREKAAAKPEDTKPKKPGLISDMLGSAPPPADALAGMTRQQAREKRAELERELARWGNDPGAAGRVTEIRQQIDRIDAGQY